jgi:hypothetical protein
MEEKDEPKEADRMKANGLHKTTSLQRVKVEYNPKKVAMRKLALNEVIKASQQLKSSRAQVETHPAKIIQVERSEKQKAASKLALDEARRLFAGKDPKIYTSIAIQSSLPMDAF